MAISDEMGDAVLNRLIENLVKAKQESGDTSADRHWWEELLQRNTTVPATKAIEAAEIISSFYGSWAAQYRIGPYSNDPKEAPDGDIPPDYMQKFSHLGQPGMAEINFVPYSHGTNRFANKGPSLLGHPISFSVFGPTIKSAAVDWQWFVTDNSAIPGLPDVLELDPAVSVYDNNPPTCVSILEAYGISSLNDVPDGLYVMVSQTGQEGSGGAGGIGDGFVNTTGNRTPIESAGEASKTEIFRVVEIEGTEVKLDPVKRVADFFAIPLAPNLPVCRAVTFITPKATRMLGIPGSGPATGQEQAFVTIPPETAANTDFMPPYDGGTLGDGTWLQGGFSAEDPTMVGPAAFYMDTPVLPVGMPVVSGDAYLEKTSDALGAPDANTMRVVSTSFTKDISVGQIVRVVEVAQDDEDVVLVSGEKRSLFGYFEILEVESLGGYAVLRRVTEVDPNSGNFTWGPFYVDDVAPNPVGKSLRLSMLVYNPVSTVYYGQHNLDAINESRLTNLIDPRWAERSVKANTYRTLPSARGEKAVFDTSTSNGGVAGSNADPGNMMDLGFRMVILPAKEDQVQMRTVPDWDNPVDSFECIIDPDVSGEDQFVYVDYSSGTILLSHPVNANSGSDPTKRGALNPNGISTMPDNPRGELILFACCVPYSQEDGQTGSGIRVTGGNFDPDSCLQGGSQSDVFGQRVLMPLKADVDDPGALAPKWPAYNSAGTQVIDSQTLATTTRRLYLAVEDEEDLLPQSGFVDILTASGDPSILNSISGFDERTCTFGYYWKGTYVDGNDGKTYTVLYGGYGGGRGGFDNLNVTSDGEYVVSLRRDVVSPDQKGLNSPDYQADTTYGHAKRATTVRMSYGNITMNLDGSISVTPGAVEGPAEELRALFPLGGDDDLARVHFDLPTQTWKIDSSPCATEDYEIGVEVSRGRLSTAMRLDFAEDTWAFSQFVNQGRSISLDVSDGQTWTTMGIEINDNSGAPNYPLPTGYMSFLPAEILTSKDSRKPLLCAVVEGSVVMSLPLDPQSGGGSPFNPYVDTRIGYAARMYRTRNLRLATAVFTNTGYDRYIDDQWEGPANPTTWATHTIQGGDGFDEIIEGLNSGGVLGAGNAIDRYAQGGGSSDERLTFTERQMRILPRYPYLVSQELEFPLTLQPGTRFALQVYSADPKNGNAGKWIAVEVVVVPADSAVPFTAANIQQLATQLNRAFYETDFDSNLTQELDKAGFFPVSNGTAPTPNHDLPTLTGFQGERQFLWVATENLGNPPGEQGDTRFDQLGLTGNKVALLCGGYGCSTEGNNYRDFYNVMLETGLAAFTEAPSTAVGSKDLIAVLGGDFTPADPSLTPRCGLFWGDYSWLSDTMDLTFLPAGPASVPRDGDRLVINGTVLTFRSAATQELDVQITPGNGAATVQALFEVVDRQLAGTVVSRTSSVGGNPALRFLVDPYHGAPVEFTEMSDDGAASPTIQLSLNGVAVPGPPYTASLPHYLEGPDVTAFDYATPDVRLDANVEPLGFDQRGVEPLGQYVGSWPIEYRENNALIVRRPRGKTPYFTGPQGGVFGGMGDAQAIFPRTKRKHPNNYLGRWAWGQPRPSIIDVSNAAEVGLASILVTYSGHSYDETQFGCALTDYAVGRMLSYNATGPDEFEVNTDIPLDNNDLIYIRGDSILADGTYEVASASSDTTFTLTGVTGGAAAAGDGLVFASPGSYQQGYESFLVYAALQEEEDRLPNPYMVFDFVKDGDLFTGNGPETAGNIGQWEGFVLGTDITLQADLAPEYVKALTFLCYRSENSQRALEGHVHSAGVQPTDFGVFTPSINYSWTDTFNVSIAANANALTGSAAVRMLYSNEHGIIDNKIGNSLVGDAGLTGGSIASGQTLPNAVYMGGGRVNLLSLQGPGGPAGLSFTSVVGGTLTEPGDPPFSQTHVEHGVFTTSTTLSYLPGMADFVSGSFPPVVTDKGQEPAVEHAGMWSVFTKLADNYAIQGQYRGGYHVGGVAGLRFSGDAQVWLSNIQQLQSTRNSAYIRRTRPIVMQYDSVAVTKEAGWNLTTGPITSQGYDDGAGHMPSGFGTGRSKNKNGEDFFVQEATVEIGLTRYDLQAFRLATLNDFWPAAKDFTHRAEVNPAVPRTEGDEAFLVGQSALDSDLPPMVGFLTGCYLTIGEDAGFKTSLLDVINDTTVNGTATFQNQGTWRIVGAPVIVGTAHQDALEIYNEAFNTANQKNVEAPESLVVAVLQLRVERTSRLDLGSTYPSSAAFGTGGDPVDQFVPDTSHNPNAGYQWRISYDSKGLQPIYVADVIDPGGSPTGSPSSIRGLTLNPSAMGPGRSELRMDLISVFGSTWNSIPATQPFGGSFTYIPSRLLGIHEVQNHRGRTTSKAYFAMLPERTMTDYFVDGITYARGVIYASARSDGLDDLLSNQTTHGVFERDEAGRVEYVGHPQRLGLGVIIDGGLGFIQGNAFRSQPKPPATDTIGSLTVFAQNAAYPFTNSLRQESNVGLQLPSTFNMVEFYEDATIVGPNGRLVFDDARAAWGLPARMTENLYFAALFGESPYLRGLDATVDVEKTSIPLPDDSVMPNNTEGMEFRSGGGVVYNRAHRTADAASSVASQLTGQTSGKGIRGLEVPAYGECLLLPKGPPTVFGSGESNWYASDSSRGVTPLDRPLYEFPGGYDFGYATKMFPIKPGPIFDPRYLTAPIGAHENAGVSQYDAYTDVRSSHRSNPGNVHQGYRHSISRQDGFFFKHDKEVEEPTSYRNMIEQQVRLLDGMVVEDVTNGTFYTVGEVGRWTGNEQHRIEIILGGAVWAGGGVEWIQIPDGTGTQTFTSDVDFPVTPGANHAVNGLSLAFAISQNPTLQSVGVGAYCDVTSAPAATLYITGPTSILPLPLPCGILVSGAPINPPSAVTQDFGPTLGLGIPGVTTDPASGTCARGSVHGSLVAAGGGHGRTFWKFEETAGGPIENFAVGEQVTLEYNDLVAGATYTATFTYGAAPPGPGATFGPQATLRDSIIDLVQTINGFSWAGAYPGFDPENGGQPEAIYVEMPTTAATGTYYHTVEFRCNRIGPDGNRWHIVPNGVPVIGSDLGLAFPIPSLIFTTYFTPADTPWGGLLGFFAPGGGYPPDYPDADGNLPFDHGTDQEILFDLGPHHDPQSDPTTVLTNGFGDRSDNNSVRRPLAGHFYRVTPNVEFVPVLGPRGVDGGLLPPYSDPYNPESQITNADAIFYSANHEFLVPNQLNGQGDVGRFLYICGTHNFHYTGWWVVINVLPDYPIPVDVPVGFGPVSTTQRNVAVLRKWGRGLQDRGGVKETNEGALPLQYRAPRLEMAMDVRTNGQGMPGGQNPYGFFNVNASVGPDYSDVHMAVGLANWSSNPATAAQVQSFTVPAAALQAAVVNDAVDFVNFAFADPVLSGQLVRFPDGNIGAGAGGGGSWIEWNVIANTAFRRGAAVTVTYNLSNLTDAQRAAVLGPNGFLQVNFYSNITGQFYAGSVPGSPDPGVKTPITIGFYSYDGHSSETDLASGDRNNYHFVNTIDGGAWTDNVVNSAAAGLRWVFSSPLVDENVGSYLHLQKPSLYRFGVKLQSQIDVDNIVDPNDPGWTSGYPREGDADAPEPTGIFRSTDIFRVNRCPNTTDIVVGGDCETYEPEIIRVGANGDTDAGRGRPILYSPLGVWGNWPDTYIPNSLMQTGSTLDPVIYALQPVARERVVTISPNDCRSNVLRGHGKGGLADTGAPREESFGVRGAGPLMSQSFTNFVNGNTPYGVENYNQANLDLSQPWVLLTRNDSVRTNVWGWDGTLATSRSGGELWNSHDPLYPTGTFVDLPPHYYSLYSWAPSSEWWQMQMPEMRRFTYQWDASATQPTLRVDLTEAFTQAMQPGAGINSPFPGHAPKGVRLNRLWVNFGLWGNKLETRQNDDLPGYLPADDPTIGENAVLGEYYAAFNLVVEIPGSQARPQPKDHIWVTCDLSAPNLPNNAFEIFLGGPVAIFRAVAGFPAADYEFQAAGTAEDTARNLANEINRMADIDANLAGAAAYAVGDRVRIEAAPSGVSGWSATGWSVGAGLANVCYIYGQQDVAIDFRGGSDNYQLHTGTASLPFGDRAPTAMATYNADEIRYGGQQARTPSGTIVVPLYVNREAGDMSPNTMERYIDVGPYAEIGDQTDGGGTLSPDWALGNYEYGFGTSSSPDIPQDGLGNDLYDQLPYNYYDLDTNRWHHEQFAGQSHNPVVWGGIDFDTANSNPGASTGVGMGLKTWRGLWTSPFVFPRFSRALASVFPRLARTGGGVRAPYSSGIVPTGDMFKRQLLRAPNEGPVSLSSAAMTGIVVSHAGSDPRPGRATAGTEAPEDPALVHQLGGTFVRGNQTTPHAFTMALTPVGDYFDPPKTPVGASYKHRISVGPQSDPNTYEGDQRFQNYGRRLLNGDGRSFKVGNWLDNILTEYGIGVPSGSMLPPGARVYLEVTMGPGPGQKPDDPPPTINPTQNDQPQGEDALCANGCWVASVKCSFDVETGDGTAYSNDVNVLGDSTEGRLGSTTKS